MPLKAMPLKNYIDKNYDGNQSAFARAVGRSRQQVQQWIDGNYIVIDGKLYSPRRDIPTPP